MLVARDAEAERLQDQLAALQQALQQAQAQAQQRADEAAQQQQQQEARAAGRLSAPAASHGGFWDGAAVDVSGVAPEGSPEPATEAGVLARARQQAAHDAELERLRTRTHSLEARIKGASDARRAGICKEAELNEQIEQLSRLLHAQGRLENLEYLRAVMLKYFELGPDSFGEVFPLLCAFLEFSPDEQQRAKAGHAAHAAGSDPSTLWGLLADTPRARRGPRRSCPAARSATTAIRLATPKAAGVWPAAHTHAAPAGHRAAERRRRSRRPWRQGRAHEEAAQRSGQAPRKGAGRAAGA